MNRHEAHWIELWGLFVITACGSAQTSRQLRDSGLRAISEAQALEVIRSTLSDSHLQSESGWQVSIGARQPLDVDIRIAGTYFGIEWVTVQDRQRYGSHIPLPAPDDLLRILPGTGDSERAQLLVLEAKQYRYDPDRKHVERGAPSAADVEARIARDVLDFLEYMRGQQAI